MTTACFAGSPARPLLACWWGTIWKNLRSRQPLAILALALLAFSTSGAAANQPSATLPQDVLRPNQELDQKFLEAHRVLNTDMIMGLFSSSPDVFFISPAGELYQGRDQVRQSIQKFFSRMVSMTGAIDRVTYLPAGDGVIAYGQVTYHRQLKGRAPDTSVVVWTDYRRKENGKWVLVFRHAHWPLNALPPSTTKTPSTGR